MKAQNPGAERRGFGTASQGGFEANNAKIQINCQSHTAAERSLRAIRLAQRFGLTPVTAELVAELAFSNGRHA